jgi:hypothetical protein
MENKRILLIKLLPERYRESFLDGDLYINTPRYFKEIESDDVVRCDPNEALFASRQFKEFSIQSKDGVWVPIEGIIGPLKFLAKDHDDFNIFCLYTFTENSFEAVDERNLNFGENFIIITNLIEFIRRFRNAVTSLRRECAHGLVEYVNPAIYDGPMGPFRKYHSFSYQNEFRFVVAGGDGTALILKLGNLRDICSWGYSADLNRLFHRTNE